MFRCFLWQAKLVVLLLCSKIALNTSWRLLLMSILGGVCHAYEMFDNYVEHGHWIEHGDGHSRVSVINMGKKS